MYVLVRLLNGYQKTLFYKIPLNFTKNNLVGTVVIVPLRKKNVSALVVKRLENLPIGTNFEIREILDLSAFPCDEKYYGFVEKLSKFYFTHPIYFYQRVKSFLTKNKKTKKNNSDPEILPEENLANVSKTNFINLTDEQQKIINEYGSFIKEEKYTPALLYGVTGSGKTEVYKKLIIKNIENNKSVILLLPEVSLAIQFQNILKKQLPQNISIFGFHSASKDQEKKELWSSLLEKKPILIIGVHLPIILPISNLGFIIVDEEHEQGFQEKKHPKINSKEAAIWRAQHYNIPILLGSATPSINSFFNVKQREWKYYQLTKRFSGNFPKVELVHLKDQSKRRGKFFWISHILEKEIAKTLQKKEQAIIYINRRGFCFFIQCKKCGFVPECQNCSVCLTLHSQENNNFLICHYCGYKKVFTNCCSKCNAGEKDLIKKGIGTQQVVNILKTIFPQALIERADLDSANKKRGWHKTVEKFANGEIDILVGTKLITKGYHFPKVTLVGILWADLNLHFPIFNAAESTLQQLIQVAGRAGRERANSKVIVQLMQEHQIFNYLNETDYLKFCLQEMELRQMANYPPFCRFVQIELKHKKEENLQKDSIEFLEILYKINDEKNLNVHILGPARPAVYKIQKVESRQIFIKSDSFVKVYELLEGVNFDEFESSIFIIPSP